MGRKTADLHALMLQQQTLIAQMWRKLRKYSRSIKCLFFTTTTIGSIDFQFLIALYVHIICCSSCGAIIIIIINTLIYFSLARMWLANLLVMCEIAFRFHSWEFTFQFSHCTLLALTDLLLHSRMKLVFPFFIPIKKHGNFEGN